MSVQRYISSSFWSDDWVDSLSIPEKLLYMYLLTNEHTNVAGVYKITIKRIKDDTGISKEEVIAILEKFSRDRKAFYINEYIVIPKWLKHQKLGQRGKLRMGANAILRGLPQEIKDFIMQPGNFEYDTSFLRENGYTPSIPHNDNTGNTDRVSENEDALSHDLDLDSDSDLDSDLDVREIDIKSVPDQNEPEKLFLHYWQHTPDIFNALSRIEAPDDWKHFWENSGVTCQQVKTAMENFIADVRAGNIERRFIPAMPDRFVLKGWITKCQSRLTPKSTSPPHGTAPPKGAAPPKKSLL